MDKDGDMKSIVMYLPQFHRVHENDEWWGEGFTDWTAVRAAEKLYQGHYQPHEPLNDNYYDLTDKSALQWQAELAGKYGIDGFCFYHYYFKKGKKILEKPAENLLEWTDINMPFCFCWANETWARTWTKVNKGNAWAEKFESAAHGEKDHGILLEQKYGREQEWEEHFKYLLPFFQDRRYIRLNDHPVFLITKPLDIDCLGEMIFCWKKIAYDYGMKDLYVIGLNIEQQKVGLDAVLLHGPGMYLTWENVKMINGVKNFAYEDVWKTAVNMTAVGDCKTYYGAIQNYDDTPRRGRNGVVLRGAEPEIFRRYLYLLARKNAEAGNEFLFINAWNEWGEGNHLEPDKRDGYAYLESVRDVMTRVNNEERESTLVEREEYVPCLQHTSEKCQNVMELKYEMYFYLLDTWMYLREKNISLDRYLLEYGYKNVALYGLGTFARHLIKELSESEVQISYIIDRNRDVQCPGMIVKSISQDLPEVDAVIVTVIYEFDSIWQTMRELVNCPVLSLAEIIKELPW